MMLEKRYLFFLLFGLFFLVYLHRLEDIPPPWFDEITYLNTGQNLAIEGRIRSDFYASRFAPGKLFNSMPLQWFLLATYFKIFGFSLFGARLFYIILSLFTLCGTYLLAKRIFNERTALYSSVSLGSSYVFFLGSRQAMPQVPATLFAVIAVLLFYIARDKDSSLFFAAAGFTAALSYLSHPIGVGIFFAIAALFLYNKIPERYFLLYVGGASIAVLPYAVYVMSDFQEYLRQTTFILKNVYNKQPIFLNILDEIPVRYFGLPPFRNAFTISGSSSDYLYRLKWMMTNVNLKLYCCEIAGKAMFLLSLFYLGVKKFKTKSQNELFLLTFTYVILLSFHPNKFGPYIYVLIPYLSICFAVFIYDLLDSVTLKQGKMYLNRFIAVLLLGMFLVSNLSFIYKELTTKRIRGYFNFMKEATAYIPKGSRVAGPPYFWLGMQKDYRFIPATEIVYEADKIMRRRINPAKFEDLLSEEQDRIIKSLFDRYKIDYILVTCHTWEEVTEVPALAMGLGPALRRYLFYNAEKRVDFLRIYYYSNLPKPNDFKEEIYYPPDGFYNVSAEYQNSLKIYKIEHH